MIIIFLMFIPVLFYYSYQVRTVLTLLYRQLANVTGGNFYSGMLPAVSGRAYANNEDDDTVESPKDPGPTQPIKQSYR